MTLDLLLTAFIACAAPGLAMACVLSMMQGCRPAPVKARQTSQSQTNQSRASQRPLRDGLRGRRP